MHGPYTVVFHGPYTIVTPKTVHFLWNTFTKYWADQITFCMSLLLVNRACRPIVIYFENKSIMYAWCSCISYLLCGSRMSKRNNQRWHAWCFYSINFVWHKNDWRETKYKDGMLVSCLLCGSRIAWNEIIKMAQEWRETKDAKMLCLCGWQLTFWGCF
jgi:hypothetical protein